MHYLISLNKFVIKHRKQFAYSTARMRTRFHLLDDLSWAQNVNITLQTLELCNLHCIRYELRNSVLPTSHPMHAYALYRIEQDRRAEAIVEGITNWHLLIDNNRLQVLIVFLDQNTLEINHWLPT